MFIAQWGIQHWAEEAKKHESYAASFGGDLTFYTAVGHDPLVPPASVTAATSQQINRFPQHMSSYTCIMH